MVKKMLHSNVGRTSYFQYFNYEYNERGWLTKVNDPIGSNPRFGFALNYNKNISNVPNLKPMYNGNISSLIWADGTKQCYSYEYDDLYRLKNANYFTYSGTWTPSNKFTEKVLQYDLNGNIKKLQRNNGTGGLMDDLTYTYDANIPNRLINVYDTKTTTLEYEFKQDALGKTPGNQEYKCDANGSLISDLNKGDKGLVISNNYLNLPVRIDFQDGRKIEYVYSASGSKLKKIVFYTDGTKDITEYFDGFEYTTAGVAIGTGEGRILIAPNKVVDYEYHFKDHLGNVRAAIRFNSPNQFSQQTHYYPFGIAMKYRNVGANTNDYLYNGKELENEFGLNWYHYGARYYDPQICRWNSIDPADEFFSPYVYVHNDPVNFLDPDGRNEDYFDDGFGNVMYLAGNTDASVNINGTEYKNIGTEYTYALNSYTDIYEVNGLIESITYKVLNDDYYQNQEPGRCYAAQEKIMKKAGYFTDGGSIAMVNEGKNGRVGSVAKTALDGVGYILSRAEEGKSLIIGVDYRDGLASNRIDNMTDHYIGVSSVTLYIATEKISVRFMDTFTNNKSLGTDTKNILNWNGNYLEGATMLNDRGNTKPFTATHLRTMK